MTPGPSEVTIRPARPDDVPAVVAMVHELAEFERAPEQCHLTEPQLQAALFAPQPAVFGHVAVSGDGQAPGTATSDPRSAATRTDEAGPPRGLAGAERAPAGTVVGYALWFLNFSTWEGVHGIYLEDLYVQPAARGTGAGRLLLTTLARICVERGYQRLDWWVLHWNPARDFYTALGAAAMDEWIPYRLSGPALHKLATPEPAERP